MQSCSKTGCGVDYAHLHMVPFSFDLISGIQKFLHIDLKFQEIKSISEIVGLNKDNLDYLYYRTHDNHQFCAFKPEFPSQIFRQVIAYYLGIPEKYRWREYPESKMIEKTIRDFEAIRVCHEQRF